MSNDKMNGISKKRNRYIPQRFGAAGEISSDSFENDIFGDNSFDDINYDPPKNPPKTIATISKASYPQNKKKKTKVTTDKHPDNRNQNAEINFDVEFDLLKEQRSLAGTKSSLAGHHDEKGAQNTTKTLDIDLNSEKEPLARNIARDYATSGGIDVINECPFEVSNDKIENNGDKFNESCLKILWELQANSKETLARIALLENAMFKNEHLAMMINQKSSLVKKIEDAKMFTTANNLPIQNANQLDKFEENLKEEKFKELAVNCLANIPDVKGNIGNQPKILKKLLLEIMDKSLIAQFSWTGKSSNGKKKSFKNLINVKDLLYKCVNRIDVNFTEILAENYLKNKILKYASDYKREKKSDIIRLPELINLSDSKVNLSHVNQVHVPTTQSKADICSDGYAVVDNNVGSVERVWDLTQKSDFQTKKYGSIEGLPLGSRILPINSTYLSGKNSEVIQKGFRFQDYDHVETYNRLSDDDPRYSVFSQQIKSIPTLNRITTHTQAQSRGAQLVALALGQKTTQTKY
ncbi:uncharacterized protein LOC116348694 [Contarinia nasturtii]|uniref:uncharacterized protein LOC116341863 n=1 Tax=Contarinia nasturtii TaxID=265458 RepID=UPI0012D41182|nr:uncharacterized protein LOC116341863 [Contarinia nasturtii]XP_031625183.1 uncharacterized protein LOC116341863 [Contarinia nasturtii]XP_031635621.1 uncharacterized protein LOC116348694 [Contarinia nasturtii]